MANKGPCTICRGSYAEHFDDAGKQKTQHAYTELEGDLVTPAQQAKREQSPSRTVMMPQMSMGMLNIQRLVEVLHEKNLLTQDEVLYIAGVGQKPTETKFRDPASVVEVRR